MSFVFPGFGSKSQSITNIQLRHKQILPRSPLPVMCKVMRTLYMLWLTLTLEHMDCGVAVFKKSFVV